MRSIRTYSPFRLAMLILVIGLAVFCARKKAPVKWNNPRDPDGDNYHPPSVQMMEGGAVAINDTILITAAAFDTNGTCSLYCWAVESELFLDSTISGTLKVYFADTGTYIIKVKSIDNDQIESPVDSIILVVTQSPPSVTLMDDMIVSINDSFVIIAVAQDNDSLPKFIWALDGINYTDTTAACSIKTIFDIAGQYTVRLKALDIDGYMSLPDEMTVIVKQNGPRVTGGGDIFVPINDTFELTAIGYDSNGTIVKYYWAVDGMNYTDSTDEGLIQIVLSDTGLHEILVKVEDDDKLFSDPSTIRVYVNPIAPRVSILENDSIVPVGDTIVFTAFGFDSNGIVVSYNWHIPALGYSQNSASCSTKVAFPDSGKLIVMVRAMDDDSIYSLWDTLSLIAVYKYPLCLFPGEGATLETLNTILKWKSGYYSNAFSVVVDTALPFSSSPISSGAIQQYILDSLLVYKTYYWQVSGFNLYGEEAQSPIHSFKTGGPSISVNKSIIDAACLTGTDGEAQYFEIWNSGIGVLNYTISETVAWVSCSLSSSSSLGEHDQIKIQYDSKDLLIGNYTGDLTIKNQQGNMPFVKVELSLIVSDSLVDVRDGQVYAVVKIGSQYWMAEDLNYGKYLSGALNSENNGIIEKYIYNDGVDTAIINGGLYQWDEAMQYTTLSGKKSICPYGWHIPSDGEWMVLEKELGMDNSELDETGPRGAGIGDLLQFGGGSGFNAMFSGQRVIALGAGGWFYHMGTTGYFWTSTQTSINGAWQRYVDVNISSIWRSGKDKKYGLCIRCIRN